jgi:protein-disulfide isomerase
LVSESQYKLLLDEQKSSSLKGEVNLSVTSRTVAVFTAAVMLTGIAASVVRAEDNSAVLAEVNGHQITRAELEKRQSGDLLQAKYKYYIAEKQAVEKLVREEILDDEARKEGVTAEELLKRHAGEIKEPTEDQIKVIYEATQSDKPYAQVRNDIRDHIIDLRRGKAEKAYFETLQKKAVTKIVLQPPTFSMTSSTGSPSLGPADAPVKIVEYADYQCPYCKQVHPLLKRLQEEFPNKTQLTYEDFPLPMHANAEKAAEAAHCAGDQGKYWEFHDAVFERATALDVPSLKELAKSVNLDQAKFDQCLDSGKQAATVAKSQTGGKDLGLTGTPTFFINGHMLGGAAKYETLRDMVVQAGGGAPDSQARAQ